MFCYDIIKKWFFKSLTALNINTERSRTQHFHSNTSQVSWLPGSGELWGNCRFCGSPCGNRTAGNGNWQVERFYPGQGCWCKKGERTGCLKLSPSVEKKTWTGTMYKPTLLKKISFNVFIRTSFIFTSYCPPTIIIHNIHTVSCCFKCNHLVKDVLQTCSQAVDVVLQLYGFAVNGVAFWMCQAGRLRGEKGEGIGPRQQQRPSQRQQLILLHKQSDTTSFTTCLFFL